MKKTVLPEFDVNSRIIKMMADHGWTQYELARRSKVAQATIASWNAGRSQPTIEKLERICKAFGISLSEFFGDEEKVFKGCNVDKEFDLIVKRLDDEQKSHLYSYAGYLDSEFSRKHRR